jgi:hypothetical protein
MCCRLNDAALRHARLGKRDLAGGRGLAPPTMAAAEATVKRCGQRGDGVQLLRATHLFKDA